MIRERIGSYFQYEEVLVTTTINNMRNEHLHFIGTTFVKTTTLLWIGAEGLFTFHKNPIDCFVFFNTLKNAHTSV